MIVPQSAPQVKFFRTVPSIVIALAKRIKNGESVRCASCYKWQDARTIRDVAAYTPWGAREPTHAYVLCRRCMKDVRGDAKTRRALADRVEAYLTGEVVK